ncbi:hypothetical protein [Winogradskyella luteola]|uniref:Uncharacterized protein n=1 Tax=Winogradskyella luteola TaxID=2828330 RepID=A0A9X1F9W0_9FLAO|nr:hypothetical protein [Winogradskyella luteola]MBV7269073.1 hypothetical protein [Winogradskyella luteola]
MVNIYSLYDDELMDLESLHKGYRNDIIVKVGNLFYKLNVYDMVRLKQDFEAEISEYGYFQIESNLIIVEEVTKENIKKTVKELEKQNYFEELKPITYLDESELKLL